MPGVQVHQELAAASAGLQEAADSHSAEAAGAAARVGAAGLCAQQLLAAIKQLLEMLTQLGAAVAAAAEREAAWQGDSQAEAEAIAAAAGLVGLAPDDIRSVMLPHASAHHSGGVQAASQQAWAVLRQVECQLAAGDWQGQGQASASLLAAIAQLTERCAQSQAALAAAQSSGSSGTAGGGGGGQLAFEDLEQRLRAAAAEVADLEARIG